MLASPSQLTSTMRSSRSDLIVPIRDRRQHRRILTLKNFAWAMGIAVAAFVGITIEANLRHSKGESGFGTLYGRQLPEPAAVKAPEVITEAPVPDATAADPMLVAASAREQLLRADSNVPATTTETPVPAPVVQASTGAVAGDAHVAIVGDSGGVTIVKDAAKPPVLGGGFGRE